METSAGWLKIGGKCPFELVRLLPKRVVLKSKKICNSPTFVKKICKSPTFRKKFGCAFGASPFCLPFQIQRRILGSKVGNLKTPRFHVDNDSQQRADKTGEAGFVGLILEK